MTSRISRAIRYLYIVAVVAALVPLFSAVPSSASTAFSDGFETGDLSAWTSNIGVTAVQQPVYAGAWAAQATGSGGAAYAYRQLASPSAEITYGLRLDVLSRSTPVTLLGLQTASGTKLITVLLNRAGKLAVQNHAIGKTTTSRLVPTGSTWHHLILHVVVAGASSRIDVSLDDPATPQIQRTDSLGTTPVGRLELGETAKGA